MKVLSFIRDGVELAPVEVELSLMPGLPQFKIMGLPDTLIKESQLKIRSAIKKQGFKLPRKSQVLVNLSPNHLKKSSRGLDLAIACAFLWETEQIPKFQKLDGLPFIYGELSLSGHVKVPDDLDSLFCHQSKKPIISGMPKNGSRFNIWAVDELSELGVPEYIEKRDFALEIKRPEIRDISFPEGVARLIEVVATGEHSLLLSGPAGSGKSTITENIYSILKDPDQQTLRQIHQVSHLMGRPTSWRPLVSPHHSIPPLSMIGGGLPPFPGEITRAHGGCLVLDELLEFHSQVKEALREPIENGVINVARRGKSVSYPACFHLMATTNLCPCGDLTPANVPNCHFSLQRCRSYLERLSGPLMDRFEILSFSDSTWLGARDVQLKDIHKTVKEAQEFAWDTRKQKKTNGRLSLSELEKTTNKFALDNLLPSHNTSHRRKLALLKVARTIADLEQSLKVESKHINDSKIWTVDSFYKLKSVHS